MPASKAGGHRAIRSKASLAKPRSRLSTSIPFAKYRSRQHFPSIIRMLSHIRIFTIMKTKLTLSISKDRVRRAKAYSARRKKSVSQLVEEFFAGLDEDGTKNKPVKKKYMIDRFAGILTGKITQKDLDEDPRLAHIFRKGL